VRYPGPTGEALPMRLVLEDWKAVDGVLYPHRLTQEVMDASPAAGVDAEPLMRIVSVRESVKHEALDPARVAPPPEVLAAIADPSKRAPRPAPDPLVCAVETIEAQPVASVRLECDATKVSETLAVVYGEVMGAIGGQGGEIVGPPFARYHEIADGKIDLEAGMPVKKAIEAHGRVKPGELPGGKAAMTWHVGSYHELQQSYDRLSAWMKSEALAPRGGFWETYWTDPGLEPDPSTWRTQIHWPVE
jgi:effector-binding domain-containing protein